MKHRKLDKEDYNQSVQNYVSSLFYISLSFYGLGAQAKDAAKFNIEFDSLVNSFSDLIRITPIYTSSKAQLHHQSVQEPLEAIVEQTDNWSIGENDMSEMFEVNEWDQPLVDIAKCNFNVLAHYNASNLREEFFTYINDANLSDYPPVSSKSISLLLERFIDRFHAEGRSVQLQWAAKNMQEYKTRLIGGLDTKPHSFL